MACCEWSDGYTEGAKDVCQPCMDREFRALYDSCPDGRCKGPRSCAKHKHLWDRPEGWPESYPPPANAAGGIVPSQRYNARGTRAEAAARERTARRVSARPYTGLLRWMMPP